MTKESKLLMFVGLLILVSVSSYMLGSFVGRRTSIEWLSGEYRKVRVASLHGQYVIEKDVQDRIAKGDINGVECISKIRISDMYDDLMECVSSESCRHMIDKNILMVSPELTSNTPRNFVYQPKIDGVRRCDQITGINGQTRLILEQSKK